MILIGGSKKQEYFGASVIVFRPWVAISPPVYVDTIEYGVGGGGLSRGPELLLQKDRKRYDAQIRRIQREDDEILEVLMQAVLMDIL